MKKSTPWYKHPMTLATAIFAAVVFLSYPKSGLTTDYKLDPNEKMIFNVQSPASLAYGAGNKMANALNAGKPFHVTVLLRSSTITAQNVSIVTDSETVNARCFITQVTIKSTGTIGWVGQGSPPFSGFSVKDTTGNVQFTISTYALTSGNYSTMSSSNVLNTFAVTLQTGTAMGYGMSAVANSTQSAGSDAYMTISGLIY